MFHHEVLVSFSTSEDIHWFKFDSIVNNIVIVTLKAYLLLLLLLTVIMIVKVCDGLCAGALLSKSLHQPVTSEGAVLTCRNHVLVAFSSLAC